MPETAVAATHITAQTTLSPAISSWEIYLNDQGRSPYTVKAFLSDVRLMTQFFPPDRALGAMTTNDLNNFAFIYLLVGHVYLYDFY